MENFKNYKTVLNGVVTCLGAMAKASIEYQKKQDAKRELMHKLLGFQHIQKNGMAFYDDCDKFLFVPDHPAGGSISPFRSQGVAQLLPDGSFDFVRKPRQRAQSKLIRKLAHGRVSETKDGAVQLTLKIGLEEGADIPVILLTEALEGEKAVVEYLSKVKKDF